ncbi:hypothetical protein [Butyrivibrio fibrisolvens]|uniref:hypothetical protein n=1 Tax=Butyrivibrio fibrisolvens TaxID=831 RepID=UPI0003B56A07|nr:hypothetical protein [Butyrivibrio fibrisolvens]
MKKIVFLSMSPKTWDGLETLWDKATADSENEVTVIPIPTYKRDSNNNLSDAQYTLLGYPDNVPITDINAYSLKANHPDIIYTQNIQDTSNFGFCVHPAFHTNTLKACTDQLVYVPYMCTEEISFDNKPYLESIKMLFICPAIKNNVDRIIVQSKNQKELYLRYLAEGNPKLIELWSSRISYNNYPRNEILKKYDRQTVYRPDEWNALLCPDSNGHKKTVLLCTSVIEILTNEHRVINKLIELFEDHLNKSDDYVLIWRPYPAIMEAIKMLRPGLVGDYDNLVSFYRQRHIGILDELPSPTSAIIIGDEYLGDACGVMELFKTTGKPVTLLDYGI